MNLKFPHACYMFHPFYPFYLLTVTFLTVRISELYSEVRYVQLRTVRASEAGGATAAVRTGPPGRLSGSQTFVRTAQNYA
jgi:hypothetical protein